MLESVLTTEITLTTFLLCSAVSVLLTIAVALIALMFVKGFKVNLAASTRAGR